MMNENLIFPINQPKNILKKSYLTRSLEQTLPRITEEQAPRSDREISLYGHSHVFSEKKS
jgi:hypothetical protein